MPACFVVSLPVKDNGVSDTWDGPTAIPGTNGPVSVGSAASGVVEVDTALAPIPVGPEPIEPLPVEPVPVEPAPVELEPVELEPGVPVPVEPVLAEPATVEPEPLEPELPVELVTVEPVVPLPPVVPIAGPAVPGAAKVRGGVVVVVVVVAAMVVEVVVAGARVVVVAGAIVVVMVVVAAIWTTAGAPGSATIPEAGFESPRPLSRIVMVMTLPTNCAPVSPSKVNACQAPPTTL